MEHTTAVSVGHDGVVHPGAGRAHQWPESFDLRLMPYSEVYPPAEPRSLFGER